MARPAPSDLTYAPQQAKSFLQATITAGDQDLTNQFPTPADGSTPTAATSGEFKWAASALLISATTAGTLSVMMQADPATAVVIAVSANTTTYIRGAFVKLNATGSLGLVSVTAFWEGGPS